MMTQKRISVSDLVHFRSSHCATPQTQNSNLLLSSTSRAAPSSASFLSSSVEINYSNFSGPDDQPPPTDPALKGSLSTCTQFYTFKGVIESEPNPVWMLGQITFPKKGQTCNPSGKSNLVLIFHADLKPLSFQNAFLYNPLSEHLASHGYVVVSIARYFGQTNVGPWEYASNDTENKGLMQSHITWLYENSSVKNVITTLVSVILHSAGGNMIPHLGIISTARTLSCLITLTPSFVASKATAISSQAKSYLGLHHSEDNDPASGNVDISPPPPQTGFYIYDKILTASNFPKDFIFFNLPFTTNPVETHYYQNTPLAKAYITAFLDLHVRNAQSLANVFKQGILPGSLSQQINIGSTQILPQHHEISGVQKLCDLSDFDSFELFTTFAITERKAGVAFQLNKWSPHTDSVAWFQWDRQLGWPTLTVKFKPQKNLQGYKFVAFRIGQVYDPTRGFSEGSEVAVRVSLIDGLSAPVATRSIVFPPKTLLTKTGYVKSAMRTYAVGISELQGPGVDLSSVKQINFELGHNPMLSKGICIISSIEAWK